MKNGMKFRSLIFIAVAFLTGFAAGFILEDYVPAKVAHGIIEIREGGWQYINPLLECEQEQSALENSELKPFSGLVDNYVTNYLNKKWGDDISVYFRDLNNGLHFEIGKDKQFYPASLVKVPLLIAILKQTETNRALLSTKITYDDPSLESHENIEETDKLILGKSYTVDDLLKRMMKYSDNISYLLLVSKVANPDVLIRTYTDLSLPNPYKNDTNNLELSTEQFATFFRILYNASYLRKAMSEKALELIDATDFKLGIEEGVPSNVKVAHKFGYLKSDGVRLFHDCGIVYYPNHPYLLCVMTKASDKEPYDPTIGELSRFVFQEINRQHGMN